MRRAAFVSIVMALVVGGVLSPAHATERKVEAPYDAPAAGSSDAGGGCLGGTGCATLASQSTEILMSVEIVDDAGGIVSASASWDTDGDGISDTGFEVCGKTAGFQGIPTSTEINVFVWAAPSSACPDAVATSGLIKVVFSDGAAPGGGGTGGGGTGGGGTGGGGNTLPAAKPRLGFSDSTPKFGTMTTARTRLGVCGSHAGTKVQLQRKQGAKFKTVATKKLNKKCKANFKVRAKFKKAVFRAFWPKQDKNHRASASKPRTVTTRK